MKKGRLGMLGAIQPRALLFVLFFIVIIIVVAKIAILADFFFIVVIIIVVIIIFIGDEVQMDGMRLRDFQVQTRTRDN